LTCAGGGVFYLIGAGGGVQVLGPLLVIHQEKDECTKQHQAERQVESSLKMSKFYTRCLTPAVVRHSSKSRESDQDEFTRRVSLV